MPAIKIGSDDFTNLFLIRKYLSHNLPTILSTGMADERDLENVLKIRGISNKKIIFLLCTSEYPTKHENVNILKLLSLKKKINKNHLIGFSDHTTDNISSIMAVAHGCCFFEKHFTLNNNLSGPDHWFSLNPKQLKIWVNSINFAYNCLGNKNIIPTKKEIKNKRNFQRKILVKNFIKKGQIIKLDNLNILRSSKKNALSANKIDQVLGKVAKYNFKKGDILKV